MNILGNIDQNFNKKILIGWKLIKTCRNIGEFLKIIIIIIIYIEIDLLKKLVHSWYNL